MTMFDDAVEAGVKAMFLAARTGAYAGLDFDEIPEEHRESWRVNFAIGLAAARKVQASASPQYRIRYLPDNVDGERGVWYTGTAFGFEHTDVTEVLRDLATYGSLGLEAKVEQRWVTEWTEVEL